MSHGWRESRRAFADAAEWFVAVTARVDGRWDRPGLGEWDVRALVGHTADLAAALGEPIDVPRTAARQALELVTELAMTDGTAGRLLLAATGRPTAAGFTVL